CRAGVQLSSDEPASGTGPGPGGSNGRDRGAKAAHRPGVYRPVVGGGRPRATGPAAVGAQRVLDVRRCRARRYGSRRRFACCSPATARRGDAAVLSRYARAAGAARAGTVFGRVLSGGGASGETGAVS